MAAIGDHDIAERVSRCRNVGHDLRVRIPRQDQLEHADRISTIGHRQDQPRAVAHAVNVDLLSPQHSFVHGVRQLNGFAAADAAAVCGVDARFPPAEADNGMAAEVGDQEAHRPSANHHRQLVCDHLDGRGWRGSLDSPAGRGDRFADAAERSWAHHRAAVFKPVWNGGVQLGHAEGCLPPLWSVQG